LQRPKPGSEKHERPDHRLLCMSSGRRGGLDQHDVEKSARKFISRQMVHVVTAAAARSQKANRRSTAAFSLMEKYQGAARWC
jgi:hypothetical protein